MTQYSIANLTPLCSKIFADKYTNLKQGYHLCAHILEGLRANWYWKDISNNYNMTLLDGDHLWQLTWSSPINNGHKSTQRYRWVILEWELRTGWHLQPFDLGCSHSSTPRCNSLRIYPWHWRPNGEFGDEDLDETKLNSNGGNEKFIKPGTNQRRRQSIKRYWRTTGTHRQIRSGLGRQLHHTQESGIRLHSSQQYEYVRQMMHIVQLDSDWEAENVPST